MKKTVAMITWTTRSAHGWFWDNGDFAYVDAEGGLPVY